MPAIAQSPVTTAGQTRREFLTIAARVAALWGLSPSLVPRLEAAVQALSTGRVPLLWLEGSNCSGCSVSLLNSYPILPVSLLTKHLSLQFHQTLSTIQGQPAVDLVNQTIAAGNYILVVEGAVPVGMPQACRFGGEYFPDHLLRAAQAASHVVAVGSCAAFGGIAAAPNNPIGAVDAISFLQGKGVNKPFIRVPGCPPHPDWMIGTLVHVIQLGIPTLDSDLRPTKFFGKELHEICPLNDLEEVKTFGTPGCLKALGCKGESTYADCAARGWNGVAMSCVQSLSPCIGCTSPNFARTTLNQWPAS
jgi:hydrogenase small subunit